MVDFPARPDFKFSGLYFPQIWQSLQSYRRSFMPELNDEDPNEPATQLLMAFAAGFHYCNVLLDHVGMETLFSTSRLRDSLRSHLSLIGYTLKEATPSAAPVLLRLASQLTSAGAIPATAAFSADGSPSISFEIDREHSLQRTDVFKYALEYDFEDDDYADVSSEIADTGAYNLWGGVRKIGDALYLGMEVLFTGVSLALSEIPISMQDPNTHVWEYRDKHDTDTTPEQVTQVGDQLIFVINGLLGLLSREGAEIVVKYLPTGASETVFSGRSDPTHNIATTGLLGQVVPSTSPDDYSVGTRWKELPNVVATEDGNTIEYEWDLPETTSREWEAHGVNGLESYWVRLRWCDDTVTGPELNGNTVPIGDQFVKAIAVQGETREEDPIGVMNGSIDQSFITKFDEIIDGSVRVFVDNGAQEVEYVRTIDFFTATQSSRVFSVEFDRDSRGIIRFGNGSLGFRPTAGSSVRAVYRVGASQDGNVGAGSIDTIKSGASFISDVSNPRPAVGWMAPEGSTPQSVASLKIDGPASLRVLERAITTDDIEYIATRHSYKGAALVSRALAVVDHYGSKTFGIFVIGTSGAYLPIEVLDDIDLAFNGDPYTGIGGALVGGFEAVTKNFDRYTVDVSITVKGGASTQLHGDIEETVKAAIADYLRPDKLREDGTFEHVPGGTVYVTNISAVAKNSDPRVIAVTAISAPAGNIPLGEFEIPVAGTITVTVIP